MEDTQSQPKNQETAPEKSTTSIDHNTSGLSNPFEIGATLVYGFHGRCVLRSLEKRSIGGESLLFYRLEIQKSQLSRSQRKEPEIWLPAHSARSLGLRYSMNQEEAERAMEIIENREYYLPYDTPWTEAQKKVDFMVKNEGGIGLAKALSYLFVANDREHGVNRDISKHYENVFKLFTREVAMATGGSIRETETRVLKELPKKLLPDN